MSFDLDTNFKNPEDGWMDKKGHVFKNWRRRYFSMDFRTKKLTYYADEAKTILKGIYEINSSSLIEKVAPQESYSNVLQLKALSGGKESVLIMSAPDEQQQDFWFEVFSEIISGVKVDIPDISSEPFRNAVALKIVYNLDEGGSTEANNGGILSPRIVSTQPFVTFSVPPGYYTLIMSDPDAPSFFSPVYREFIHWVVVNIEGNDISTGTVIAPYVGAGPPCNSGLHRYFTVLFRQQDILPEAKVAGARTYFQARGGLKAIEWARGEEMEPLGINGFQSQWDAYVDDVHDSLGFMPPEEYRSPKQKEKFQALEDERASIAAMKAEEAQKLAEEVEKMKGTQMEKEAFRKAREEEAARKEIELQEALQKAEERKAAIAAAAKTDPVLATMLKYDIETRGVFDGMWINKKFNNESLYRKRFCWIDEATKTFYWSKTEGKNDPKKKGIHLVNDCPPKGVRCNNTYWNIRHRDASAGKGVDLQITGQSNNADVAGDWAEVASTINEESV